MTKALVVLQPYALCIVNGWKKPENRAHNLFRNLIAPQRMFILAGKSRDLMTPAHRDTVCANLESMGRPELVDQFLAEWDALPFGAIVGEATATGWVEESEDPWFDGPPAYGLMFRDAERYLTPFPWRGPQGLFNVELPTRSDI